MDYQHPPHPQHHPPSRLQPNLPLPLTVSLPQPPSHFAPFAQPHPPPHTAPLPTYTHQPNHRRSGLKRSHPTSSPSAASSGLGLTGAVPSPVLSSSPPVSTASSAQSNPLHLRARSSSSSLDPIAEWPLAEVDSPGLYRAGGLPLPDPAGDEVEDRPRVKRVKREPDHEGFARLSLASPAVGGKGNAQQLPTPPLFSPFSYPPIAPSAPSVFSNPPSSPTSSAFPAAPPTSPVHATSRATLSAAPKQAGLPAAGGLPEQPRFPSPFFAPSLPGAGAGAATGGGGGAVSAASIPEEQPAQQAEDEVDMAPAASSWDIDAHRVYVASLEDSPPTSTTPLPDLSVNPLALTSASSSSSTLPPEVLSSLRPSSSSNQPGSLILYRPPPFPGALGSAAPTPGGGESAKDRALRERREKKDEEYEAFLRAQAREERAHDGEHESGSGTVDGEGMDVDDEL
ncbi:hypothetical protein JCM10213_006914 [Rhodosporidiobolus nylandii]